MLWMSAIYFFFNTAPAVVVVQVKALLVLGIFVLIKMLRAMCLPEVILLNQALFNLALQSHHVQ